MMQNFQKCKTVGFLDQLHKETIDMLLISSPLSFLNGEQFSLRRAHYTTIKNKLAAHVIQPEDNFYKNLFHPQTNFYLTV